MHTRTGSCAADHAAPPCRGWGGGGHCSARPVGGGSAGGSGCQVLLHAARAHSIGHALPHSGGRVCVCMCACACVCVCVLVRALGCVGVGVGMGVGISVGGRLGRGAGVRALGVEVDGWVVRVGGARLLSCNVNSTALPCPLLMSQVLCMHLMLSCITAYNALAGLLPILPAAAPHGTQVGAQCGGYVGSPAHWRARTLFQRLLDGSVWAACAWHVLRAKAAG